LATKLEFNPHSAAHVIFINVYGNLAIGDFV
jgi:hypothetical protein